MVWSHCQEGMSTATYAVYFDAVRPGQQSSESPIPFLGDGDALFTDQSDGFLITALHCKPTMADWNGDGRLDLLVGENGGHIFFFENIGTRQEPRFARGRFLTLDDQPLKFKGIVAPCAVDWDEDGLVDLLVGCPHGEVVFLQNVGTRTEPKLVSRGKLEADGKPIVIPHQLTPGENIFTRESTCMPNVVDWNGDGRPDLLVGGYISGAIFYFENVGKAQGIPQLVARGPISADGKVVRVGWAASPCAADFRSNGCFDLITACGGVQRGHGAPPGLAYLKNVGTRTSPELQEAGLPLCSAVRGGRRTGALRRRLEWRRPAGSGDRRLHAGPPLPQRGQPQRTAVRTGPDAEEPVGTGTHGRVCHLADRLESRWASGSGLQCLGAHRPEAQRRGAQSAPLGRCRPAQRRWQADRLCFSPWAIRRCFPWSRISTAMACPI